MAADPTTKNTVSDLLNYDVSDDDDPFQDIDEALRVRDDKPTLSPRAAKRKVDDDKENDVLGLDEEVKITKKRKPIAKLDETRSVSLLIHSNIYCSTGMLIKC
jgi:replication fork protection complex subunit Csm3/Swi3